MALRIKPDRGPAGPSETKTAPKIRSIRSKILRRVLPVALIPLLLLGGLATAGILLIQQRTADAVGSAEEILSEEVVQDAVSRSSERAARDLADYIDQWMFRIDRMNGQATFRELVVATSNETKDANFSSMNGSDLATAAVGDLTRSTRVLALTVEDDLKTVEDEVQVLLVSEQGYSLGSTNDTTIVDYSDAGWFQRSRSTGSSTRSYVNDGEGPPAFEIAIWTEPPATTTGGAVLRVRVPLTNVHLILDELAADDAVDVVLVDSSASVILGDTTVLHSADVVFGASNLMIDDSGFNRVLLAPGVVQDETRVTSAREISDRMTSADNIRFQWLVQTSQPIDLASSSLTEIRQVSDDVSVLRQYLLIGVLGLVAVAGLLTFAAVRSVANNITKPVKVLSDQAQSAANEGIPLVVEAARTSEELPELPAFEVDSNDELSLLAHSMNTMQEAAVDLAAGQAKLRRQNVARTFVSLGRRNQNLLNRQLEFIDDLERQESDADALENLFRLDHLATRMRRNAENLLVLAGEQSPRRWGKPVAVRDVLRAAASEIVDYQRVRLGDIDTATVSGNLATDLSHLIAELLENAGSFSPPNTRIEVLGQHTSTHYRLAIVDQGIGMDPAALSQVNDRLRNPVDFADAPSAYLGLFVVGRLAQELGITVRLASADQTGEGRRRGTIAFIDLPVSLLSSDAATPIEINERTSEGVARRAEQADATAAAIAAQAPTPERIEAPIPQRAHALSAETTSAGFPKRSRGTTDPIAETPAPHEAPVAADVAPAAPPTEITSAGFPKRHSATGEAVESTQLLPPAVPESVAVPKRDASEVSNSLRRIRAAVARGRASGIDDAADMTGSDRSIHDPDSLTPPAVPMANPAPAPAVPAPAPEAMQQPVSNQPTQPRSE
ncbi:MAG: signal transduction histidine kinase [Verrucomicrobiales bacterium]|jgi:signal transduction histidine kinase